MKRGSYFITGIGTHVGKTIVSSILVKALGFDYWKPIQTGEEMGTDTAFIRRIIPEGQQVYQELYCLKLPASPHLAAKAEGISIRMDRLLECYNVLAQTERPLLIEGAGGLLVPLTENELMIDLIERLHLPVILVSRNYLGSINHSLLTAAVLKQRDIKVAGWVFNDTFMSYESDIVRISGFPSLASIPGVSNPDENFLHEQADQLRDRLRDTL